MSRKRISKILLIIICALFVQNPASLLAQKYRTGLKKPPVDVYKSMLEYVEKKDYAGVGACLKLVRPVTSSIKKRFEADLEEEITGAIEKKEREAILKGVEKLIYLDLKELLSAQDTGEFSVQKLKMWTKIAYLDYLLLSPKVKAKNLSSDATIRKCFKMAYLSMDRSSPFSRKREGVDDYRENVEKIESELKRIFPHFMMKKD